MPKKTTSGTRSGLLHFKKNVAICYRTKTPEAKSLASDLARWLKEKNYQAYTSGSHKSALPGSLGLMKAEKDIKDLSLLVVIGGDGTYLEAVRWLGPAQVPILGVNLGSLGFLTPVRKSEMFLSVERALLGKLELRSRTMIDVKVCFHGKKEQVFTALNDVVIERGAQPQLINIEMVSEKSEIGRVKADGMVIATPTGSTAYNLAAGGPILHPAASVIVVTPICAHSLTSRPLIVPDDRTFSIRILNKTEKAHIIVDGRQVGFLHHTDQVLVRRSERVHWVVREPSHNYFNLLSEKLKFTQRE